MFFLKATVRLVALVTVVHSPWLFAAEHSDRTPTPNATTSRYEGKAHSRWSAIFLVAVAILFCLPTASAAEGTEPLQGAESRSVGVRVIPRPARIEAGEGRFTLTAQSTILVSKDTQPIGNYLAARLAPATGYPLKVAAETPDIGRAGTIGLSLSGDAGRLGDEGYALQVLADRVLIQAANPAGLFYAGILKYIDLLAHHKLNRLHLHLTDGDGWRIEIKQYPRLTEVGAWADYGDEAEMRYWSECPKCQERQKKVGNLHAWFMERLRLPAVTRR